MRPGAVVDVSNVCCSPILPPRPGSEGCVWRRLDTLIDAWRRSEGREAPLVLIADNSLKHYVEPSVRRRWRHVRERYDLLEAPVADDDVLDVARDRELYVISGDKFKDYRKLHPWIEREPDRFLHWDVRQGAVQFVPVGITPIPRYQASELAEKHALRGQHLDPERDARIFTRRWKCTNRVCLQALFWHEQLLLWPRLDEQQRVVCPSCGHPLEDLGPRALLRELIVFDDQTEAELLRFPLEEGPPLVVGRGEIEHGIDLRVAGRRHEVVTSRVSRQHLLLRLERHGLQRARVIAVDLGSRNGSSVRRCVNGQLGDPRAVRPGEEVHLRRGDGCVLAKTVRLEVSGQRFIAGPASPPAGAPTPTETTVVPRG